MDLIVVVRVIVMCCVCGSCSDVLLLLEVVSVHSSPSPAQPSPAQPSPAPVSFIFSWAEPRRAGPPA